MDFAFVSGSLGVKSAELKKIETQLNGLVSKSNDEIIVFLNHLQIGGSSEITDFNKLILGGEKVLVQELQALLDEEHYFLLDAVFSDEVLTFLNLRANHIKYLPKFVDFDFLHLSLKDLLEGVLPGYQDYYLKLLAPLEKDDKLNSRTREALVVKSFYRLLNEKLRDNSFLDIKETAINLRTLFRARKLGLSTEDYVLELIGNDAKRDRFTAFYRLEERQLLASVREKVDGKAAEIYEAIVTNPSRVDELIDEYVEIKLRNIVFSYDPIDQFILYGINKKRILKTIRKIYHRVEKYEPSSNN